MSHAALGLAKLASVLSRDLQRVARAVGGPDALWDLSRRDFGAALRLSGAHLNAAEAVRRDFDPVDHHAELRRRGMRFVGRESFPERLCEIFDPPFGLFVAGARPSTIFEYEGPVVAIVGARKATASGVDFARRLASELADRGACVISGLAYGIDAAAHLGALEAGGLTTEVLGCGADVVYPKRNRALAGRVGSSGGLASEYWPGTSPAPWRFPARNRIVSGLAHATIVVEAGERSGALITADFAAEHGRPVLAVPGAPWAVQSAGSNTLIRAGAALCESVDDVVDELSGLGWREPSSVGAQVELGAAARDVLTVLRREPATVDQLGQALGSVPGTVMGALSELELAGWVVREPGGRYVAAVAVPRTP
jgi:DNA processing protein